MYFKNRAEAGRLLAAKMDHYKGQHVAILALSPGAIIVGAQIAMRLHSNLTMLLTESIYLPGEIEAIASMSSSNNFTYNNMFSAGEIEELVSEYHGYIAEQRLTMMHRINTLITHDGEVNKNRLRNHVVILVADGLPNGFSLDIATEFFKTIKTKKLIIATPIASVSAVDRMHLLGDNIFALGVTPNYISTNHYYDDNTIPPLQDMFKVMRNIALHWERPNMHVLLRDHETKLATKRRAAKKRTVRHATIPRHIY